MSAIQRSSTSFEINNYMILNSNIFIEPFNAKQLNPNSYNLRVHNELMVYDETILDMRIKNTGASDRLGMFIHVTAGFEDMGFAGF